MFTTLRDEMVYFEGAFKAIMMAKTMSEEENTVFQWALDSIEYILNSQNWLDDEWVRVGFQNIEKAKALLLKMLADDNYPDDFYLGHARERLREAGGIHPIERSLLAEEKVEHYESIFRRAINDHNQQFMEGARASKTGIVGHGGENGMRSLIRSRSTGQTTATKATAATYSSEELKRLKDVFEILRMRTCLTQAGKDVFTKAIGEVENAMRGLPYNSQTIEAAKDLHAKILEGDGHGRSRAPGLIKDEVPTRWEHGDHNHGGHSGHGGHGH